MAKTQLVNLGRAIEERRKELGLSQTRLAQRFPVDPKTVSRWENGENPGAYNSLEVVAEHLETTANALQARALAVGRENGDPVSRSGSAEESETVAALLARINELESQAESRHSTLMSKLSEVSDGLERLEKREQLPGRGRASGSKK